MAVRGGPGRQGRGSEEVSMGHTQGVHDRLRARQERQKGKMRANPKPCGERGTQGANSNK